MAEPGRISQAGGAGNGVITFGGKSISMIRSQRGRIEDAIRDAYARAETNRNLTRAEQAAEIRRLNARMDRTNQTAIRYEANIQEQPEYQSLSNQMVEIFRNGVGSPEEARRTAQRVSELYSRRNNLRYGRSIYARNNRRN